MTSVFNYALAALAVTSLVACASTPTADVAAAPSAPAAAAVSSTSSKVAAAAPNGYRVVNQGGQELYCRRQLLTGSRTKATETCLTKAQLDAQRAGTEDYLRRIQSTPVDTAGQADGSGGRTGGVMTQ